MVPSGYGFDTVPSNDNCLPLPPPSGNVINVGPAQATALDEIVQGAAAGDTILLADGIYELRGDYLWFGTPGVTIRSASGNREAVIIDGGYETTEIVVVAASDVTVSDLTLKRARYHPIHVMSVNGANTDNTLIYNTHIIDPGQLAIKINPNTPSHYPDFGQVACSHLELTDAGR